MDISSELIHALLPLFLVTTLGLPVSTVGIIEGIAEATAAAIKVFSGAISDWIGRRKPLLLLGYGLAALTKPLFPLATGASLIVAARVIDRIGKGIREAPRDALVADITPPASRGAAFGLRQSLDTVGALVGPLLAMALMLWLAGDLRSVMWAAVPPALVALALVAVIAEPPSRATTDGRRFPISRSELVKLDARYWWVVGVGTVFTLARFSEAFLVLRGREAGLPLAWTPLVMVAMTVAYSASAYPAGALADRIDRRHLLALGICFLVLADGALAIPFGVGGVMIGAALWGLHMGFTQGLLAALVADTAPDELRGTAFGMFNLTTGVVLLLASTLAGYLWSAFGSTATFLAGAALAGLSLVMFVARRPQQC